MKKPVVLVVMDGVGLGDKGPGDAVFHAKTPNLCNLLKNNPHTQLKAHGDAVGLPTDEDMGNSEVGHNALGCGQIYAQGAKLVTLGPRILRAETAAIASAAAVMTLWGDL